MPGSEKFLIGSVGCSDQMRGHQMWDIPIGGGGLAAWMVKEFTQGRREEVEVY